MKSGSDARDWYHLAVFPRFIWVCEISTVVNAAEQVIGELVMDATAAPSDKADALIIAHYPKRIYCKLPEDASYDSEYDGSLDFHKLCSWRPFEHYDSNLTPFEA